MPTLLGWLAVLAVAAAAMLFGQTSKQVVRSYPVGGVPVRVRTGIAVSITGPVLAVLAGTLFGLLDSNWGLAGAVTVALVAGTAILGLLLSPQ